MNRRNLLRGILAAGMAPALVKAEILMPMKRVSLLDYKIWTPVAGIRHGSFQENVIVFSDYAYWPSVSDDMEKSMGRPDEWVVTGDMAELMNKCMQDEMRKYAGRTV